MAGKSKKAPGFPQQPTDDKGKQKKQQSPAKSTITRMAFSNPGLRRLSRVDTERASGGM